MRTHMKKLMVLGMAAAMSAGLLAQAGSVQYSNVFPVTTTPWTNFWNNVPKFDPTLGQLTQVIFSIQSAADTKFSVSNNSAAAESGALQTRITFNSKSGPIALGAPQLLNILFPNDGPDAYGWHGYSFSDLAPGGYIVTDKYSTNLVFSRVYSDATTLGQFTGPGTLNFTNYVVVSSSAHYTAGNSDVKQFTHADDSISVIYNYTDAAPKRSALTLTKRAVSVTTYPSTWTIPISKGEQFVSGDYWLRLEYGQTSFDVWGPGNLNSYGTLDEQWHHVVGRFTRGSAAWGPHLSEILVDGVVVASRSAMGVPQPSSASLMLGAYLGNSYFYAGLMDEVRLSHVARSDAWLSTSHAQQQNAGAFIAFGAEEASAVPGYAHRRLLTINGAMVAGALTDFPVLVSTIQDSLRTGVTSATGADIVFSSASGQLLAHEIELFHQAAGRLVSWVKVPALAAGVSTQFYMNYGNPAAGAPPYPPTAVWDAGFSMVQHLAAGSGVVLDSTINANTGTVHGATATAFGSADGAYEFNGVDQFIEMPNTPSLQLNTTDFTMEGWFCRKSVNAGALFEVTVTNAGPDTALNVSVSDPLAPNFSLVQPEASVGSYDAATGIWQIGDLPVGGSATLELAVNLNSLGTLTNTATVAHSDSLGLDGIHFAGYGQQASAWVSTSSNGVPVVPPVVIERPDFVVTAITTTPATLTNGCAFTATVTVVNQGPVAGDAGKLRLWLNKLAAAAVGEAGDATLTLGTLAAGGSTTVTFTGLTANAVAGTYNLRAFVDADGATTEQSEGNNQKTLTYTLSSSGSGSVEKPDFVVTAIATTPAVLTNGATFSATVTVLNQGLAAGDAGVVRVWVNHFAAASVGEAGDSAQSAGTLAVGASGILTFTGLTAPNAAGTYNLRAFVDADGTTTEQSEGNNQKTLTYAIAAAGGGSGGGSGNGGGSGSGGGSGNGGSTYVEKPDFTVTDVSFSPTDLTRGGTFTAYVTVVNNGPVAGDAGYLDVYVDHIAVVPAGTAGDANQSVGAMAAGETRILTFTGLTVPNTMGTHTFRAFIDSRDTTVEQSEGNNQKTRTYGFY